MSEIARKVRKDKNSSAPLITVFYLPQFTENLHTPTEYTYYMSHHPKHQKLTVAKTLLSRVSTHITDKTQKHSELQNICNTTSFLPEPLF